MQRIKYKDLKFTTVARNKCMTCGGFKRKKPCPPFNKSVKYYMEKFAKYRKIYMVVMRTDGTIPWRNGIDPEKLVKKVDRGLKGVAKGMPIIMHSKLLEIRSKNPGRADIYISGSCSACRPCNVGGKCLKGAFAHSPEGSGIDVMNTIRDLGFEIQDIPYDYIVNVGFVGFKRRANNG